MKTNLTRARSGFTLVEMLVVIAILAVLAGFGFGTYFLVNKNAKVTQAEVMLENLSTHLEIRANQSFTQQDLTDLGGTLEPGTRYPSGAGDDTSTSGLYAFLSGDYDNSGSVDDDRLPTFPQIDPEYDGKGKYLNAENLIIDPWLKPLRYQFPGVENNVEDGFDLWSAGPDKKFDTEDDIKNW